MKDFSSKNVSWWILVRQNFISKFSLRDKTKLQSVQNGVGEGVGTSVHQGENIIKKVAIKSAVQSIGKCHVVRSYNSDSAV